MRERAERVVNRVATDAACAWCGGVLPRPARGPRPTYCRASCRQRAYELRRAQRRIGRGLGAAAVSDPPRERVIERTVERPYPTTLAGWRQAVAALVDQAAAGGLAGATRVDLAAELRRAAVLLEPPASTPRPRSAPSTNYDTATVARVVSAACADPDRAVTLDQVAGRVGMDTGQATRYLAVAVRSDLLRVWRTGRNGDTDVSADQLVGLPPHARFRARLSRR